MSFSKSQLDEYDHNLIAKMVQRFDKLSGIKNGQSILITGGTGLIGRILTISLIQLSLKNHLNLKIYLLTRSKEKARKIFGFVNNDVKFIEADINNDLNKINLDNNIDMVVHAAANTRSYDMKYRPVNVINSIVEGTRHVLEFANANHVQKFIYLSSMEIYGVTSLNDGIITENFTGNVNINSVRSSYPEGKRLAEVLVRAFAYQHNFTAIILRPTQTFGMGVNFNDNRVFAQFTREALLNKKIVMLTKGETIRSYVSTLDCVSAIIHTMDMVDTTDVFNIANSDATISIYELAQMIKRNLDNGTTIQIENTNAEKLGYAPVLQMKLSNAKLRAIGWEPEYPIEDMVKQLIHDFKHQLDDSE